MIIKIYAQNTLNAFSKLETAGEFFNITVQTNPDIAIFTEAYEIGEEKYLPKIVSNFKDKGYAVLHGPYDETDGRKDQHGILLAVRSNLIANQKALTLTRIGNHNVVEAQLQNKKNKAVHFFGIHLNDRNEKRRQHELVDLLSLIHPDNKPTILAGDFNSLHKSDARGKIYRKARLTHLMVRLKLHPITEPTGEPTAYTRGRRGSVMYRLHEMASGETVSRIESAGLKDTDSKHTPTFPSSDPIAQLDHIMVSKHFKVQNFQVLSAGPSDHLGIVATIKL